MTDPLERTAEALLLDALEMGEEKRDAFLVESCGANHELLALTRRMLRVHFDLQSFFNLPAGQGQDSLEGGPFAGSDALHGTHLDDFELLEEIGRGGMGLVFRARQGSLDREVAVKVLPPALASTRLRLERFRREAFAVSKLQHPGVVPILSYGEADGIVYYAMELVEGPSLARVLQAARGGEKLPGVLPICGDPLAVARVTVSLLRAVEHVHERGVLHRDIKPHNILLDPAGAPRLIDFGLAKDFELSGLTRSGETAGTPHYMSPEQARATKHPIDKRTDLYSVGAVLYELLSLQPPFSGCGMAEIFMKIASEEPRSLRAIDPRIPRELELICLKALRKEPDERYDSADSMADDLERYLQGESVIARPVPLDTRVKRALLKRRTLLKASPLLLGLGSLGGIWFYQAQARAAERGGYPSMTLRWSEAGDATAYSLADGELVFTSGSPRAMASGSSGDLECRLDPVEQRVLLVGENGAFAELRPQLEPGDRVERYVRLAHPDDVSNEMVLVPGGEVDLSEACYANYSASQEGRVQIAPFFIDVATVSRGEFREFLRVTGREDELQWQPWLNAEGLSSLPDPWALPATNVSWHSAQRYAEWCGKRLPSQAEWNLAMRGTIAEWAGATDEQSLGRINLRHEQDELVRSGLDGSLNFAAHIRASRDPRARFGSPGMFHPVGNVVEWSETLFVGDMREAKGVWRVLSGLSFRGKRATALEPASPLVAIMPPSSSSWDIGFRCAKSQAVDPAAR